MDCLLRRLINSYMHVVCMTPFVGLSAFTPVIASVVSPPRPCNSKDLNATPADGDDDDDATSTEHPENSLPLIPKRGPRPVTSKKPLQFPEQFEQFFSSSGKTEFEPVAKALQQRHPVATPVNDVDEEDGSEVDENIGDGAWLPEDQPNTKH